MDRLATLLQFHQEDPSDAFTRFALASEYLKRGETDQALLFFERLAEEIPQYVGTYYHLGSLYETLGRPADATRTYEAGIQHASQQRDHHSRAELQDALMRLQGVGWDDE